MAPMTGVCSVEACPRPHYAHGWCTAHYRRWKLDGDPGAQRPIQSRCHTPEQALRQKVEDRLDGCRLWTGWLNHHGYGFISVGGGRERLVHRYVWEQEHGPIPPGISVDHICHSRACVNVEHLRLATNHENEANRRGPTRANSTSGVRNVYSTRGRWGVYIKKGGKTRYFGTYDTVEQAAEVAAARRRELFGDFAGRG